MLLSDGTVLNADIFISSGSSNLPALLERENPSATLEGVMATTIDAGDFNFL